ncbi:NAD(P)H-hydrate dehydratase [Novosphingobium kaempferiae]|uniref:NAD(P)H-hydrate dehydratase n=1 Tax=Novosphingobium kaempferiae TaxID=2896849 RepID=UPI001E44BA16|nr:NAD(P)H-hydrate dehydratase [Novosphingobium kaempferiae]
MADKGTPVSPPVVAPLDRATLRDHPLPMPSGEVDKNSRGRVTVIGGCLEVPGGVRLTAEAALRSGAGKVRIATVAPIAHMIGTLFPEAAITALPASASGEIAASASEISPLVGKCDAIVVGPAMSCRHHASRLVDTLLDSITLDHRVVIDAAALMSLSQHADRLKKRTRPALLTPHPGEIAAMLDIDGADLASDAVSIAMLAARRFNAVVVLKGSCTTIANPSGAIYGFNGGTTGLATSGSGDVLAGIAGGLLARGCEPLDAALWAVWLHGEAGRRCAETIAPLGFLASDLLPLIPGLMHSAGQS